MEEGRPSATSMIAALSRAAHLFLDGEPKVLHDDLALSLSGVENEAALRAILKTFVTEVAQRTDPEFAQGVFTLYRAFVVMRNRYAEDALEQALARGVQQYVLLGAGLDSFAYRRRDLAKRVRVFEVDYPATQQWKRSRLQTLNVPLPSHLTFIPVNFEQQTLQAALQAGGYQVEQPGFFSWLGVTQYLTEEAVFTTLRMVARGAPGSEIVFEYSLPDTLLDDENRRIMAVFKAGSAARGEPWLSLFEPARLAARVKELGFTEVEDFGPEAANARYFSGRTDGLRLRVPGSAHLMKARV
jgi:methyltransferase (TIGR00027 family)